MDQALAREWVKGTLKGELRKRGMTYAYLAGRLREIGIEETEASLRNKLSRGTFSAAFFFQCLAAIGVPNVQVDLLDFIRSTRPFDHSGQPKLVNPIQVGNEPIVVRLRWSNVRPTGSSVIRMPSDEYRRHLGVRCTHVCGHCNTPLLVGWLADQVQSRFEGTDSVAQCSKCGVYNELPGSKAAVGEWRY